MNFSTQLFRCSSLGHLMTAPKGKDKNDLSETAKTHLIDVWVSAKYDRRTNIDNKYVRKGLMVEEDAITLYSRVNRKFFKKNEEPLSNLFIKGTCDNYEGESIRNATHVIDFKSSWDIYTFFRNLSKDINSDYWWQLQGYMALTGAKTATLAYVLVDTPEVLINDEKRKLLWKMGVTSEENADFIEACAEIDKLSRYDDIPLAERIIEFPVEYDEEQVYNLYDKIRKARIWLNDFEYERFGTLGDDEPIQQFDPTQIPLTKL